MTLLDELKSQVSNRLIRAGSVTCSKWAQNYVVLGKPKPGPLTFYWHPWEKEMMDCDFDWCGPKSAQMGYTNTALCRAIHANDIKKIDVLYLLPKRSPDAADFSKSKFDTMLELSTHLAGIYSNVRNIGHKQAGSVNLFIRGTRSRSGLKLISAGLQIWDELDEMPQKQLALAVERSSGYDEEDCQNIKISTPTIPDFGISAAFKLSDQSIFVFKCPKCGRRTSLRFPECLVVTADSLSDVKGLKNSHIICPECKGRLEHREKPNFLALEKGAKWEPQVKGFETRGFYINQLYSTVVPPWKIAETFLKGQNEQSEIQEFWNSKGGLPHLPEGARISDKDINAAKREHRRDSLPPQGQLITLGVDVGKRIHIWADQWLLPEVIGKDLNMFAKCRNIWHGTVPGYEELWEKLVYFQAVHTVIDWQPDERLTYEFCFRAPGRITRCYFHKGAKGKLINRNVDEMIVGVNRNAWLDLALSRFMNQTITVPQDIEEEACVHLKNLVRMPKKDPDGNPIIKYISVGSDHYGLARMYSEVALPLAVSATRSEDVTNFL